jgi:hypothetical protein
MQKYFEIDTFAAKLLCSLELKILNIVIIGTSDRYLIVYDSIKWNIITYI